jgi:hypothetical protein
MYRTRFIAVYTALALVVAAGAYGSFRGAQLRGPVHSGVADRCEAPKVGGDPVMTAVLFIHTAVERTNPRAGFALTTPAFRRSTTCADWARGNLPVKEYRQVDWSRSQYVVQTRVPDQVVLEVLLASSTRPDEQPALFLLELRRLGAEWRVGYWGSPSDLEL